MDYVEQGLLKLKGYISIRPPLLTFCIVKSVDADEALLGKEKERVELHLKHDLTYLFMHSLHLFIMDNSKNSVAKNKISQSLITSYFFNRA